MKSYTRRPTLLASLCLMAFAAVLTWAQAPAEAPADNPAVIVVGIGDPGNRAGIIPLDEGGVLATPDARGRVAFRARVVDTDGLTTATISVPGASSTIRPNNQPSAFVTAYMMAKIQPSGRYEVKVTGTDRLGNVSTRTVTMTYVPGEATPQPSIPQAGSPQPGQ